MGVIEVVDGAIIVGIGSGSNSWYNTFVWDFIYFLITFKYLIYLESILK
jgi:hypothetical protein